MYKSTKGKYAKNHYKKFGHLQLLSTVQLNFYYKWYANCYKKEKKKKKKRKKLVTINEHVTLFLRKSRRKRKL